jgi:hypothetical protein
MIDLYQPVALESSCVPRWVRMDRLSAIEGPILTAPFQ